MKALINDKEPPKVESLSFRLNGKTVIGSAVTLTDRDTLTAVVKATDESKISQMFLRARNKENDVEIISETYDCKSTDDNTYEWEVHFESGKIDESLNGVYSFTYIEVVDEANNRAYFRNDQISYTFTLNYPNNEND